MNAHRYNRDCDCSSCDRIYNTEQRLSGASVLAFWDSCEIRFTVRSPEAVDIGFSGELPVGWVVKECVRVERLRAFSLVFEVQGEPTARDGAIVYRILQRMGVSVP